MAIVKKYIAEVVSVISPIEYIYTIEFKSLSGTFKYSPGQFLHLALDEYDPSAAWPDSRCFSMQSAPGNEYITITYAAKGDYTHRMANELKLGKVVTLKLPFGELFDEEYTGKNVVFIAGGTGITPFLSLFCHESFAGYHQPTLYLGVRSKGLHIYKQELEKAVAINPSFKVFVVCEDTDGRLDIEKILAENNIQATYFISGPPVMIKNFKNFLTTNGVAEVLVRTDDWE